MSKQNIFSIGRSNFLIVLVLAGLLLNTVLFGPPLPRAEAAGQWNLSFDGTDSVNVGDLTAIEGAGALTVEAWAKGTDYINAMILGKHNSGSDGSFFLGYINATTIQFTVINSIGTRINHTATYALDANWHHIAGVYNGTNARIYVDGVQVGSTTALTGNINPSTHSAIIGNYTPGNWPWSGEIDEVRVWNTERTAQQIADNKNLEIEEETGLVARWGMNEGSGNQIIDSAGGNTGTITGATWAATSPLDAIVANTGPSSLTSSSATLNGSISSMGGESSLSVYFKWGDDPNNLNQTTASTNKNAVGSFSQNISGLLANKTYYYQSYADGTLRHATSEITSFGVNALSFDGNDSVNVGDLTTIEGAGALTVEAWAKGTDYTNALIISKHFGGTDGSFYLGYINSTTIRFMTVNNSSVRVNHDVTYALDANWHHIAGVYNGSDMRIYVDGTQVGTTTPQTGTIKANARAGRIGDYEVLDFPWTGQIDEIRLWTSARTAQQIQDNMSSEIETGTGLAYRWGLNEGAGTSVGDTAGSTTGTITGATWTTGYSFNQAPSAPSLNSPADNATKTSLSQNLSVGVNDADGNDMSVSLYGRRQFTPDDDFTIMTIPDPQYYSSTYPATFASQTQWIANNVDDLNIKMTLGLGDLVDHGSFANEWTNAMAALNTLGTNDIPNLLSIGNHDYDDLAATRGATTFNSNLVYGDWYSGKSWFNGGAYEANKSENVYTKMTIGSLKFLFMTLEFGPRQGVIDWANQVISDNSDHQVIIATHNYMNFDDTRVGTGDQYNPNDYGIGSDAHDGEEMWTELVKLHENIIMVTSGHILNDGVGRLTSTGDNGNSVFEILSNYQVQPNGGNGWLRYYTFKPSENKIYAYTYSPTLAQFDTTPANQFTLNYDFYGATDDYSTLFTDASVAPGSTVTYDWTGLNSGWEYEWYAAASDGVATTNNTLWSFTTDNPPTASFDNDFSATNSGNITVNYNLTDADSDTANLSQTATSGIEYSRDGSAWADATDAGGASEGLTGLAAAAGSSNHVFVWASGTDLADIDDESVYLRIRPNDGVEDASSWVTSNAFSVNNYVAPTPTPTPSATATITATATTTATETATVTATATSSVTTSPTATRTPWVFKTPKNKKDRWLLSESVNQTTNSGTPSGAFTLTMRVVINGQPVRNTIVELHSKIQKAKTDNEGYVTFNNVESGDHKIKLVYNNRVYEEPLKLEGDQNKVKVEIELKEASSRDYNSYLVWIIFILLGLVAYLLVFSNLHQHPSFSTKPLRS